MPAAAATINARFLGVSQKFCRVFSDRSAISSLSFSSCRSSSVTRCTATLQPLGEDLSYQRTHRPVVGAGELF